VEKDMKNHDVQLYLKALSKALCGRYPIDYPTILAISQDKLLELERNGKVTYSFLGFRPLLRRAIINAVIDKSRKVKKQNEREIPYAVVCSSSEDVEGSIANMHATDTHEHNPPEQCDWKDFVDTRLNDTERLLVNTLSEMPHAFEFTGDGIKELRGALRRYLKQQGVSERKFWAMLDELKRKLSERTGVRRTYNGTV
jgi:hypothetical protein